MSRIGKQPVAIPPEVTVVVGEDLVEVSGPKGKLFTRNVPGVTVTLSKDGRVLTAERAKDTRQARAYHGLMRALLHNAVTGVSVGFTRILMIEGVGYRADVKGKEIVFQLGYSHPINFAIPDDVDVEIDKKNRITISGIDKQRVGQMAADIRRLRPPEVYKGKGIRYSDEIIHRKVGKAGA